MELLLQTYLNDIGFTVKTNKSVTYPTQVIEHLGFIFNSLRPSDAYMRR